MSSTSWVGAFAVSMVMAPAALAGDDVLFDQIGGQPFFATALSSSQFTPGEPEGAFTTVDNFTLTSPGFAGTPLQITRIEAAVAGLSNFNGFEFIDSWTVQIYSSPEASVQSLEGDVFSASFDFPADFTTGFGSFFGDPVELASFDVNVVLDPGDYWLSIVMGNDFDVNGVVGIAGSSIGDGPAFFSGPGLDDFVALGNPAAYRIIGSPVPGPGAALLLGAAMIGRRRSRR